MLSTVYDYVKIDITFQIQADQSILNKQPNLVWTQAQNIKKNNASDLVHIEVK